MQIDLSKITIRKIEEKDIETMTGYRIAYLTELQGERDIEYVNDLRKELADYFRKALSEGKVVALVAESEGNPLSFGAMVIKEIPGDFNKASYLEGDILNMYTLPEARRKGLSGLVLERLIDESRRLGISKLALHTTKDGEKLYRRFGFSDPAYPVLELGLE